ncbi:MAG: hypothetical protein M1358_02305 [Chloroflexi bacterium]|nr:hypothetical protein [Chloroflexota bacterium]
MAEAQSQGTPVQLGTTATMMEDYALRRVPASWTWSWWAINWSLSGTGTAMFWLAFGGTVALAFGPWNMIIACFYATIVQGFMSLPIMKHSVDDGLDVDLLSRGMGFGFLGSAFVSAIYFAGWLVFFAIEGTIMSDSVAHWLGTPAWPWYIVVGLTFIPLNLYGMKFITRWQQWTFPLYVILVAGAIIMMWRDPTASARGIGWLAAGPEGGVISAMGILGAAAAINGVLGIDALLVMDFSRFGPKPLSRKGWWGLTAASFGPDTFFPFMMIMPLGAWFAVSMNQVDPGVYFVNLLGPLGVFFVLLTQWRINTNNCYSGTLCLANFFSRVGQFVPGRKWWIVVMCILGIAAMFSGVFLWMNQVLTVLGAFFFAWIADLLADTLIVRGRLKLTPEHVEYRRAYLYSTNPVGTVAVLAASIVGALMAFAPNFGITGTAGTLLNETAFVAAFIIAFVLHIAIAIWTQGKYYIAREPKWHPDAGKVDVMVCPTCNERVAVLDVVDCPEKGGAWLCSHCCMANRTCHEMCLKEAPAPAPQPAAGS